jgi:DNA polymerase-3 subunit gamma/tau
MFENVLCQEAVSQLSADIKSAKLAPSMLFAGPAASGKGTAALELGRALSCGKDAPWNCPCPSCARHRLLYHPDLLAMGSRPFSPEIAAAGEVFIRENAEMPARTLFIRAVRKLLLRFNPILWEDDPRFSKFFPLLEGLEDGLNEIAAGEAGASAENTAWAEKLAVSIRKSAFKLEADGIADQVPVSQIRRVSYWMRMAPLGRCKFLLIENADRMQDAARNALLKILEEPPERAFIVLATSRAPALLPTIVSRLRPYRFSRRGEAVEKDVIRRVFRGAEAPAAAVSPPAAAGEGDSLITGYLESFLPVSGGNLYPLAAFFAASLAAQALLALRNQSPPLPPPAGIVALGKYAAPIAESSGLGRPAKEAGVCIGTVLAGAERFEAPGLFPRFLSRLLSLVSRNFRAAPSDGSPQAAQGAADGEAPAPGDISRLAGVFRELAAEAASAVGTYNLSPELALEKFRACFIQKALERGAG